jgi:hypothetical protein
MMDEYERPLSLDKYLKELATARAGGGQASDTPIAAMQNFSSTVSTTGDSATPPSAQVGMEIAVANNGANSMNVFRHRAGQPASTQVAVAASTITLSFCGVAGRWWTKWGTNYRELCTR